MNANELKSYIIDNNYTYGILDKLECHDIREYATEYRAGLPNKSNKTSISIKKDTLFTAVRCGEGTTKGDLFTLVMMIKHIAFGEASKLIHSMLGLTYSYSTKGKQSSESANDMLQIFKSIKRKKYTISKDDVYVYSDNILQEYSNLPHISLIHEGIMPFTCERFNVGYDFKHKRIVFPERKWDGTENEYIGISGRTTVTNYEQLGIPKYFKLSKTYPKGSNIYGLNENYKTIQEAGYIVVFEAQKSVLKRHSRLDGTASSIGCCELTDEQVKILIGLNVDIILAYDEGITLNHIWKECEKFYGIRNVSYIYDDTGILPKGSKDSPADLSNADYMRLFNNKKTYGVSQHKQYKESKGV